MYCVGNTLDNDRDVYGRRELFAALQEGPDRRVFLVGMRRTGKTATLLWLERQAQTRDDVVALYIAPEGSESVDAVRDRFANALSRRRKLLPALPGGFLQLRQMPLDVLLMAANDAADQAGRELLVLIDEADALATVADADPSIVRVLRAGLLSGDRTRVLVTGSRQATRLRDDSFGGPEPLLAGFVSRTLSPVLDRAAARDLVALQQRGGEGRADFSPAQVEWLLDRTGGHPYLTQAACDQALRLRAGPESALDAVMLSHPAMHAFQQDLERTSPTERLVLQAVVDRQPLPEGKAPFVASLIDIGLLTPEHGLSVPVLGAFVRRVGWSNIPSRLRDEAVAPASQAPPTATDGVRYRAVRPLGEGGFGEVVLMEAQSPRGVRRLVAVKFLRPDWANRAHVAARLRNEARILALLRHRAIVRAEDIVQLGERLGVLMEYVPGVDLKDVLNGSSTVGLVPPRAVAEIAAEVAEALDVAYNRAPEGESAPVRVLHRDIKPHNIRLTMDGEIKILDFGVAGAEFSGQEEVSRQGGGTVFYMAPERHLGVHEHPASDIFSLGVVLLELAAGIVPDSPWPTSRYGLEALRVPMLDYLDERGGGDLMPLIAPMLEHDPEDRPTAEEVVAAARRMAPRLKGPDLRSWARAVVPRLDGLPRGPAGPGLDDFSSTPEGTVTLRSLLEDEAP